VTRRIRTGLRNLGEKLLLLGATREELDGSEWAHVVHGHLGGRPPRVDLAAERALAELLAGCAADALVTGAHDLSEGGLAQALVEACVIGRRGARVELPAGDPFVTLFSESTARVLVTVAPDRLVELTRRAAEHGVPLTELGTVTGSENGLCIAGVGDLSMDQLCTAWETPLSNLFSS
jgi:phosphoribosylformylglycinamidine (FGAM) synthase-like enzyme